jgi:hypothetical protein
VAKHRQLVGSRSVASLTRRAASKGGCGWSLVTTAASTKSGVGLGYAISKYPRVALSRGGNSFIMPRPKTKKPSERVGSGSCGQLKMRANLLIIDGLSVLCRTVPYHTILTFEICTYVY